MAVGVVEAGAVGVGDGEGEGGVVEDCAGVAAGETLCCEFVD